MKNITSEHLKALGRGWKTHFQTGMLGDEPSEWERIATYIPSTNQEEVYGFLKELPGMSKWEDERKIHEVAGEGYTVTNEDFELTLGVGRNQIMFDRLSLHGPLFQQMGQSAKENPDDLVFHLVNNGHQLKCSDGKPFFAENHPVLDKRGKATTFSNIATGAEPAWYVMDTKKPLKPFMFQEAKKPEFVAMDNPDDPNVFKNKKFLYGIDSIQAAAFGYHQMAYRSQLALTEENLQAAIIALNTIPKDYGRKSGVRANLLVVPDQLEFVALKILTALYESGGGSNVMHGRLELMISSRLE